MSICFATAIDGLEAPYDQEKLPSVSDDAIVSEDIHPRAAQSSLKFQEKNSPLSSIFRSKSKSCYQTGN
jgi:hypothetical protein